MGETVLDQFGFKRFSVRSQPEDKRTVVPLPSIGYCDFIGYPVDLDGEGHYCSDKSFCPKRIFADAKVFVNAQLE